MKKKLTMSTKNGITLEEGCNLHLENCRQRNLREGTIRHYKDCYQYQHDARRRQAEEASVLSTKNEKRHLSKAIDYDRDIEPYQFVKIYAGVGSGKNTLIDNLVKGGEIEHKSNPFPPLPPLHQNSPI